MTITHKPSELLTRSAMGHTLHHHGVFSPDGQWIVFDARNDDTKIGETRSIGVVNVSTGEESTIYETQNATVYGPGVGAASFSPVKDFVIFIHGLAHASREKPYGMSRRTGVGIDMHQAFQPVMMDARDVTFPYTPGSLRGGTHSHAWSADGQLISFTYNDELADPDLRVVGVMVPYAPGVQVDSAPGNNSGKYYSAIVTDVVRKPVPGSDEISKAFDECWVNGYTDREGREHPYVLAFQGHTRNAEGRQVTEVFLVEIDPQKILADSQAVGEAGERPRVPAGIRQKRLTFSEKGLSDTRHWLRSDPQGQYIYALAKDEKGHDQIIQIEIRTGGTRYLTRNPFSVDFAFNVSPDGEKISYVGANQVHILDIGKEESVQLTHHSDADGKVTGAPCFSPQGDMLVYNQYVKNGKGEAFLQIRKVRL
ncbi:MAG: DUF3748 domain-containing protein [Leadbetterella sp.]|nr:DUF3748 domain-containing protein [Leadbetterella sp.]